MSSSQKGFLPGIAGIQEHTFILKSSIQECKKSKTNLFISYGSTYLMLSGRFIMLFGRFFMSPTTGVRQGDGLWPILCNLATELLIKYVTKYRGLKLFDNNLHITTYADDYAILSNSENGMKLMLETW